MKQQYVLVCACVGEEMAMVDDCDGGDDGDESRDKLPSDVNLLFTWCHAFAQNV